MKTDKVDVIINVYGKPWQTLCTLKSLMKHSGNHIDKIYFIEEREQPYKSNVNDILKYFDNIICFIPEKYQFLPKVKTGGDLSIKENRYNFRYQYGIENSDKKYVFITHNDVLYSGDIIGDLLNEIEDCVGIGSIGQCWNCPCYMAKECNGEKFNTYNPTYEHILELCEMYNPPRKYQFLDFLDDETPMPLPECRLNEYSCLINREIVVDKCFPNGKVHFFGDYTGIDLSSQWFRDLILEGYKFKNYNIGKSIHHAFYSNNKEGVQVQISIQSYIKSEIFAKEYFYNYLNFN